MPSSCGIRGPGRGQNSWRRDDAATRFGVARATCPVPQRVTRVILSVKMTGRLGNDHPPTMDKEILMHKTMLAIILCTTFALPASADTISGGKITAVNSGKTSFNYSKRKRHWTFKITDTTLIRVGKKTGNLSDLRTGQPAKIEFQRQGSALAALIIGIAF